MKTILVVEDDSSMRWLLKNLLRDKYLVITKNNGMEALSWLSADNIPDLIISDIRMPLMDGFELLENLSVSGLFKNIPVLMITGFDATATRKRCLALGAYDYLAKPFSPTELLGKLPSRLFQKCSYNLNQLMETLTHFSTSLTIQVLQVHRMHFAEQGDHYLPDGVRVHHALLTQAIEQLSTRTNGIDAVIVGPECSSSDIAELVKIAGRKIVPVILNTLSFDWKAKEIAIETGADEYHVGFLDEKFVKRVRQIKKTKFMNTDRRKRHAQEKDPVANFKMLKRFFDIVTVVLIILLLLPALIIIVPFLMVASKGSILSRSERVGMNYQTFDLYEFKWPSAEDGRKISGIRRFLKWQHLAGLPQILNVLKGDMSLVGTYPVSPQDAEMLTKDRIAARFLVPPGIVGLWRLIPEANKTDVLDYAKQDAAYAMSHSILLDIRILFLHFLNVIDKRDQAWMCQRASI